MDLRVAYDEFVHGINGHQPHGIPYILRRIRRDSEQRPIRCSCSTTAQVLEPNPRCPFCLGEGFLWDESWTIGFSRQRGQDGPTWTPGGSIKADYRVFYLRYDTAIRQGDKVVVPALDIEGRVLQPLRREVIYMPENVLEMRADGGRLEFYTVPCRESDAVRPDVWK
jgi:hypothetical protein